jgi:hypothetical protein
MKILVISESINVEDSSGSKVNVALITNLKKAGYQLKVLHYSHKKVQLEGIECHLIKENKFSLLYLLSRLVRYFQRKTNININSRLEYLFGFSFTHSNDTNSIAKSILNEVKDTTDLIITLSKGGSFRPHRAMLKLAHLQYKWLAYIHDPYPFHIYPRPYNWVEKSYEHKEKFMRSITEKATNLAFPSLLLKDWMASYFNEVSKKSIIIPHQIGDEFPFQKLPEFFNKKQFSLLHAGNLLKQRNPEFLIKGFFQFIENNLLNKNETKLILIGHNDEHKELLSQFQNHPNIIIRDYIEYRIVQSLEKNVSVNIILEAISEISPFLPGKFPNCVAANKPIIILGPYYSEVKRLLGKNYINWSEANDKDAIEKIISKLYYKWKNNPEKLKLDRKDLIEYCSEEKLKSAIDSIKIL